MTEEKTPPRGRVNSPVSGPRSSASVRRSPPKRSLTGTTRAVARIVADTRIEGRLGRFIVHSDEPVERGGDDSGPSPLQFLMAAVAF